MTHPAVFRPLHVVESWRPVVSGYTSRNWELVRAQAQAGGFEPRVLVTSRQFTYGEGTIECAVDVAPLHRLCRVSTRERWQRRIRPFSLDGRSLERSLEAALDDWGADLIHVHWSSRIGRAAARVAERRRIPLVSEVRFDLAGAMTSQTLRRSWPWLEGLVRRRFESHLPRSAAIIAAGPALATFLEDFFPSLRERIWTVTNGVHPDVFVPGPPDDAQRTALGLQGRVVVGSTSNMLFYEGLDLLLQALAEARRELPALHALLVGSGPESGRLRHLARALGVPTTFTGRMPTSAIPAVLRQIDLYVIPRRDFTITRYAGPLKLVEAMASGRAIAATPVGDISHMLDEGRGALVPLGSASALARVIVDLCRSPATRADMAARARGYAARELTWRAAAELHRSIYRSALCGETSGVDRRR